MSKKNETKNKRLSLFLPGVKIGKSENNEKINNLSNTKELLELTDSASSSEDNKKKNITNNKKYNDLMEKLKNKDEEINIMKSKLEKLIGSGRKIIIPKNVNILDYYTNENSNTNKKYKCMWDHNFIDDIPFYLPIRFTNGTYYVYGYFSSPEASMAYNNNMMNDSDQNKKERNALINQLYYDLTGKYENIKPAPSPEIINDYPYGHLSLEDYRNNLLIGKKTYIIYIPPMVPVFPKIEEKGYFENNNKKIFKNITENESPVKKYRLQRSKPMPNEQNNLINTLGIKIKKKK